MSSEFDLINDWFNWSETHPSIIKGIGDDAAILSVSSDKQLVVTSDTLISGVHFPSETKPHAIAHKALAVNLSDLAAMGADPAWFTLAITLPEYNETWLQAFSTGLKELAHQYAIHLIGGDTTRGALSITITAMGLATPKDLMVRSSAKHDDRLYVTGTLGDAAAGLAMLQGRLKQSSQHCIERLNYPQPCIAESRFIRQYANVCIDISDGLLADCQHILEASKVGAVIDVDNIPLCDDLQSMNKSFALNYALKGGDDYELLFTVSADKYKKFERDSQQNGLVCYCIGRIDQHVQGIKTADNQPLIPKGYNHFIGTKN